MTLKLKNHCILLMFLIFAIFIAGCSADKSDTKKSEKPEESTTIVSGGDIHVAIDAQPPTLDPQITTTTATKEIARHIFETLLVLDPNYEVAPMLAESFEKSEDGLTYTFKLREGIKFHNGKEMTAEDVAASMNRWLKKSTRAANAIGEGEFVVEDDYVVALKIKKPTIGIFDIVASTNQFAAIMPKEIIENAPEEGINEIVGTGPFKLVEWKQDQYVHLEKYDGYQSLNTPSKGLSGKKEALVDNIYFNIVNDGSTRLAGITTGQYDLAYQIPYDSYEQIKSSSDVTPLLNLYGGISFVFNKKEGVFTDEKIRQAVNLGINNEDILFGAMGNKDFYRLDNGLMYQEQAKWYTDSGKDFYNQNDTKKAKELLEESSYKGQTVRILATRDYEYIYNTAVVMKDQLEALGIKTEIDIVDWPTLTQKRTEPSSYDAYITSFSPVSIPTQLLALDPTYPGWAESEKLKSLTEEIRTASTDEEAFDKWVESQKYNWSEYVPYIKIGDFYTFSAYRDSIAGNSYFEGIILWNTSLNK
ncbi:ABC transporter substrate-binding protein [Cytobacillus depressus]|uniref:ABC transporter substrate-binding protein n=1 Tax=Cytobacillus depressus TaxID=1602942 RepID=A0A6L3VBP9_9BACI|nr:ABC transporter substrate-binding protein [Cytobacillus depressus]KAB2338602.1 ABC transporter substrate-binding protein [Cytobacillus depressus]